MVLCLQACLEWFWQSVSIYTLINITNTLGVDRYVFFRADADYYRSSRPITDILNRYACLV